MNNKIVASSIIIIAIAAIGYFAWSASNQAAPMPETAMPDAGNESAAPMPADTMPDDTNEPAQPTAAADVTVDANVETNVGTHTVRYTDNGYEPAQLTVAAGETVTFVNASSRAMWTASDVHPTHRNYDGTSLMQHCGDATATAFDECGSAQPGDTWSFTFQKTGTWQYHNHRYPVDTGTVTVE